MYCRKMSGPLLSPNIFGSIPTRLPCCLSFRRAKVYPSGSFYIKIVGKCTVCDSYFEGVVYEKPTATSR